MIFERLLESVISLRSCHQRPVPHGNMGRRVAARESVTANVMAGSDLERERARGGVCIEPQRGQASIS